jgi:transposase-like protein
MFTSLIDFNDFFKTEKNCISYFIKMRWNKKVSCVYSSCSKTKNKCYKLKNGKSFKCADCSKTFSYKTGTIFENSNITMKKWFLAIYLFTSHKKGISSIQLGKYLKIRQATAWFVLQRLREVGKDFFNDVFEGTNEIDEVYLGGKSENKHMKERINLKQKNTKQTILGIINRDKKQVKAIKVDSSKAYDLQEQIYNNITEGSNIITDEYKAYTSLGWFSYNHNTINHSQGEYVKKDSKEAFKIHTNTIEGFWSIVKRTINGTHHWVSKRHIQRYLNEMMLRYNTREEKDTNRFEMLIKKVEGVRLKYKVLVG